MESPVAPISSVPVSDAGVGGQLTIKTLSDRIAYIENSVNANIKNQEKLLESTKGYLEAKITSSDDFMQYAQISGWIFFGLVGVLAFLGYKSISDVSRQSEELISAKVNEHIAKRMMEAGSSVGQLDSILSEAAAAERKIKEFESAFGKKMSEYTNYDLSDHDVSGIMKKLVDDEGRVSEENRAKMISILRKIVNEPYIDMYDGNFYFNAAARASGLDQHKLASELAEIAYRKYPTGPHNIRLIRLRVEAGDLTDIPKIKSLIANLTLDHPEIVLSESWNIAEHTATHYEFIKWIEHLISSRPNGGEGETYIPSYAYIILGQLYLRWGVPGADEKAEEYFNKGLELHQNEAPLASWYNHTIKEYVKVRIMCEKKKNLKLERASA